LRERQEQHCLKERAEDLERKETRRKQEKAGKNVPMVNLIQPYSEKEDLESYLDILEETLTRAAIPEDNWINHASIHLPAKSLDLMRDIIASPDATYQTINREHQVIPRVKRPFNSLAEKSN